MWGDTTLESVSWGDSIDGPLDIRPLVVKFVLLLSILDIHIFHFPLKIFGQIHNLAIIFVLQFNLGFLSEKLKSSLFFVLLNHFLSNSFISVWIVVPWFRVVK